MIPASDAIFFRAHSSHYKNNAWQPSGFRKQGVAMSVDWSRFSSAEEAHQRAKHPQKNAIFSFNVGAVREIHDGKANLRVLHEPVWGRAASKSEPAIPMNRAHSGVHWLDDAKARVMLGRIYMTEIPLGTSPKPKTRIDQLLSSFSCFWVKLTDWIY